MHRHHPRYRRNHDRFHYVRNSLCVCTDTPPRIGYRLANPSLSHLHRLHRCPLITDASPPHHIGYGLATQHRRISIGFGISPITDASTATVNPPAQPTHHSRSASATVKPPYHWCMRVGYGLAPPITDASPTCSFTPTVRLAYVLVFQLLPRP